MTGAAQGLGRVIAKRLAEEGAKVVVCDIQEERLAVAARELREETGKPFLAVGGDLSEPGSPTMSSSGRSTPMGRSTPWSTTPLR